MRVQAAARAAPPALADSLVPMLTRLPQDYVPVALLESLREATPATLATLTEDVCEASLSGQLGGCDEACVAGAWLCAASLGARSRGLRRRSRRALHALLGQDLFADPHGVS
ncbi:uncharacterized protein LOC135083623 [Ostrinia nubilalis]|uniref:uncharacterized protein LOC135083623 n=1 Tax=Ostrinia nubilalis TaxID=29057 RepID=UPI00308250D6